MHPMVNIALAAARKAGEIIARAADRLDMIEVGRKSGNDFVTEIDRAAEREIIEQMRFARSLGEPLGHIGNRQLMLLAVA